MKLRAAWLPMLILSAMVHWAWAQEPGRVVQLPTFSMYTTGTTVAVPDRGSVYLGGIKRAATGRNEFGVPLLPFRPFRNNAFGQERSASGMYISATIHDFAAMDEYLLSQPVSTRWLGQSGAVPRAIAGGASPPSASGHPAISTTWRLAASPSAPPTMSLAEARHQRARRQETRSEEAASFFTRGQKAEAEGKVNVAKIYYQMAARRASGHLKVRVLAKLDAIQHVGTRSTVAQRTP